MKYQHKTKTPRAYNVAQRPGESKEAYAKRLFKVADRRLERLEDLSKHKDYKGVKNYGYNKTVLNLGPSKRFRRKSNYEADNIDKRIAEAKEFILSPTSTKSGITAVYKERANTFNKKYGTDFTWQQYGAFFESEEYKKMENEFKYDEKIIQAAISIYKKGKEVSPEDIMKANETNMMIDEDEVVDAIAKKLIKAGYNYDSLFSKIIK